MHTYGREKGGVFANYSGWMTACYELNLESKIWADQRLPYKP